MSDILSQTINITDQGNHNALKVPGSFPQFRGRTSAPNPNGGATNLGKVISQGAFYI
jgi:hypothetical protein